MAKLLYTLPRADDRTVDPDIDDIILIFDRPVTLGNTGSATIYDSNTVGSWSNHELRHTINVNLFEIVILSKQQKKELLNGRD